MKVDLEALSALHATLSDPIESSTGQEVRQTLTDAYPAMRDELLAARKVVEVAKKEHGWPDEPLQTALAEYDQATGKA